MTSARAQWMPRTTSSGAIVAAAGSLPSHRRTEEKLHASTTQLGEVLPHGRQGRPEMRCLRDVVEADHADVAGHVQARVADRVDQSECHLIVRREDRGEVRNLQKLLTRVVAELGRPVAENRRGRRNVARAHLCEKPAHPRLGFDPILWSGDVIDLPMSEADQVFCGEARPRQLVDRKRVVRIEVGGLQGHVGNVERLRGQGAEDPHLRCDDDQTLDRLGDQVSETCGDGLADRPDRCSRCSPSSHVRAPPPRSRRCSTRVRTSNFPRRGFRWSGSDS